MTPRPRIWTIPALLAVVSIVGLLSGLLGDGIWDALSWLSLGLLPAVIAVCVWRRGPSGSGVTRRAPPP